MHKFKSKSAFTLAELLTVVAIFAILAAVAIPVFTSQLEETKQAVDAANMRTALSLAQLNVTLTGYVDGKDSTSGYFDLESGTIIGTNDLTGLTGYNQATQDYKSLGGTSFGYELEPKTSVIYVANFTTILAPGGFYQYVPTNQAQAIWYPVVY